MDEAELWQQALHYVNSALAKAGAVCAVSARISQDCILDGLWLPAMLLMEADQARLQLNSSFL